MESAENMVREMGATIVTAGLQESELSYKMKIYMVNNYLIPYKDEQYCFEDRTRFLRLRERNTEPEKWHSDSVTSRKKKNVEGSMKAMLSLSYLLFYHTNTA